VSIALVPVCATLAFAVLAPIEPVGFLIAISGTVATDFCLHSLVARFAAGLVAFLFATYRGWRTPGLRLYRTDRLEVPWPTTRRHGSVHGVACRCPMATRSPASVVRGWVSATGRSSVGGGGLATLASSFGAPGR
jgi:hypothetical protein